MKERKSSIEPMEEKGSEDEDYDESSTSILEPQEEREQEIQAPPNKKKKTQAFAGYASIRSTGTAAT
jgi:hypothetical protein